MSIFNQSVLSVWRMPLLLALLASMFLVKGGIPPTFAAEPQVRLAQAQQQPVQSLPQPNFEMIRALYELTALKEELKVLRNRVEEMLFKYEISSRRQQDLIQDVDHRLSELEENERGILVRLQALETLPPSHSGQVPTDSVAVADDSADMTGSVGDTVVEEPLPTDTQDGDGGQTGNAEPVNTVTVSSAKPDPDTTPAGNGSSSVSLNEQEAYDAAFDALKQSRYQDAIEQFQALVNTWPESQLADDSLYWMSEAYYVTREFEAALNGFRALVESHPDSSRVPEGMLKVGYIQYDIGAYDQAASTFEEILARFPGHQVTVPASIRLRRINQTIR